MKCKFCGKETTKKSFCSRKCMYDSKRKERAICPNCGKPASRAETKFCSMKCRDEYKKKINEKNREYRTCIICGTKTLNEKYCSMKCLGEDRKTMDYYKSNLPNEHQWSEEELQYLRENYGYLSLEEICDHFNLSEGAIIATAKRYDIKSARKWTNEEIEIAREHLNEPSYLLDHLDKSPSAIANQIKRIALEGTQYDYNTSPEKICEDILIELGISYEYEKRIDKYWTDFLVDKLDIEVQGTYYHVDPRFYKNESELTERQKVQIVRDKKKQAILGIEGYQVLYIWEHDLYVNREKCKELIGVAVLKSRN